MSKFEKIGYGGYFNACKEAYKGLELPEDFEEIVKDEYDEIKLPARGTKYSAGYDFFAPFSFKLRPKESIKIPTGIKCKLDENKFLGIVPRSSLGFKYQIKLSNTFGVIDADYYNNENNEGHIFIKLINESIENKELIIRRGEAFAQGIILPYFLTEDDTASDTRVGGIGSTNGK